MPLTRGQILAELDRRGALPPQFQAEFTKIKSGGDPDFLKTLAPERAALVQAIAEGREKPPSPTRAGGAELLGQVNSYKPGFNAADAASQQATRVDLAKGDMGKNVRSLQTAIGHLGTLADDSDHLGNYTLPFITQPFNYLKNKAAIGSGATAQREFGENRQAVADELETAFRGGRGGTLQGTKGWAENLNLNDAPAQQRAAIAKAAHLLQSRIAAVGDQASAGMRTTTDGLSLLSPDAQATMKKLVAPGFVPGGPLQPPGAGGSGNPSGGGPGGGSGGGTNPAMTLASGPTRRVDDPDIARKVADMVRSGATPDQINSAYPGHNFPVDSIKAVQDALRKNPNAPVSVQAFHDEPNSIATRIASSVPAAVMANAADAVVPAGLVSKGLKGDLDAIRQYHPDASLAGSVIGGLVPAAGLEGAALRVLPNATTWAPRLADAAYGAYHGFGNADEGHGGTGAVVGGVTSGMLGMAGRGIARGVGNATAGVRNDAVDYLRSVGVPLTVGQTLGGMAKGAEDRIGGLPFVDDVVKARRREGIQAFDQAGFDQATSPLGTIGGYVGPTTTSGVIGERGINLARDMRSQGYSAALDGVQVQADAPFASDMLAASRAGQQLPDPMRGNAAATLNMRVGNSLGYNAGRQGQLNVGLTGDDFQQAVRGLRRDTKAVQDLPYGHDFGQVTGQAESALEGLLDRQAPGVVGDYRTANQVNRNVSVLQDAVDRGRNGARTGEPGWFAPSTLADAASANAKRFGGTQGTTDQPFFDLTRAGQAVLPSSVPDSGTTGRYAMLALPSTLSAVGSGAGYEGGDTRGGAEIGLGTGALLSLAGSRGAQRGLVSLLADRPDLLRRLGSQIYDNAGLAGIPLVAGSSQVPALASPR